MEHTKTTIQLNNLTQEEMGFINKAAKYLNKDVDSFVRETLIESAKNTLLFAGYTESEYQKSLTKKSGNNN